MTLFFLILLTVSLTIFGFQKLKKKTKLTIKPSLPKIEEPEPIETQILEKPVESEKPIQPPEPEPIIPEPESPTPASEPEETPEWPPKPGLQPALPPEEEPMLLSPKDPEPPGNLPV